jgi:hypothetical protein
MIVLAQVDASVTFSGSCVFTDAILVEEQRDDADPPESADVDLTFDRTKYDAVTARVRWTGSKVEFDGKVIVVGRGSAVSFDEDMTPGNQITSKFSPVGDPWSIPSEDYVPPTPATCPVTPPVSVTKTPRMYGNKPSILSILLGESPAKMQTFKLFQGLSLQKQNKGNVAVTGEITSVDESILYANAAICYELAPFSGMRRDEIIRDLVTTNNLGRVVGDEFVPLEVICPIGRVVTKPILLSNASFLNFINDFIEPENWFASFDTEGRLYIREIELKDAPLPADWTLDEALGDFDLDSMEEIPPTNPPTGYFFTVTTPVKGTGPGGSSLTITTRTVEEDQELYNPECVKVRPSGAASHLLGDGTYHDLAAEELMLVQRKTTDVTTVDGQETKRVVVTEQFYNPNAYDPNFNTHPAGTSYNGAYGGKSFHRDEVESLMVVSEVSIETQRDLNGTILGTVQITKGWGAPHRGACYTDSNRTAIVNRADLTPPAYVYAGGTTRIQPSETYDVLEKIEKVYLYASDGTLSSTTETVTSWYSPDSRCDLSVTTIDPTIPPIQGPDTPPLDTPPPPPPPPPPGPQPTPIPGPTWHPILVGPLRSSTSGSGITAVVFRISVESGPAGSAGVSPFIGSADLGAIVPFRGAGSLAGIGSWAAAPVLNSADESSCEITFSFEKRSIPTNAAHEDQFQYYAGVRINISGVDYFSNNITFEPLAM